SGTVGGATILPGWVGIDVAGELERRLQMPVHLDNDANLGALAESVLGAGRDAQEMTYLMLSSGIGAGLILGGRLYRGAGGTAAAEDMRIVPGALADRAELLGALVLVVGQSDRALTGRAREAVGR